MKGEDCWANKNKTFIFIDADWKVICSFEYKILF